MGARKSADKRDELQFPWESDILWDQPPTRRRAATAASEEFIIIIIVTCTINDWERASRLLLVEIALPLSFPWEHLRTIVYTSRWAELTAARDCTFFDESASTATHFAPEYNTKIEGAISQRRRTAAPLFCAVQYFIYFCSIHERQAGEQYSNLNGEKWNISRLEIVFFSVIFPLTRSMILFYFFETPQLSMWILRLIKCKVNGWKCCCFCTFLENFWSINFQNVFHAVLRVAWRTFRGFTDQPWLNSHSQLTFWWCLTMSHVRWCCAVCEGFCDGIKSCKQVKSEFIWHGKAIAKASLCLFGD